MLVRERCRGKVEPGKGERRGKHMVNCPVARCLHFVQEAVLRGSAQLYNLFNLVHLLSGDKLRRR